MTTPPLTLAAIRDGAEARVLHFGAMNDAYRNRLMSMGLTPGTVFKVERRAPMGDPIEISLRGFRLSLREVESREMRVEAV